MTVSVIVPCYNHARFVPDAIDSILAQTYTDWEAIIVDDGSTDDTRQVSAQFTDPRIHYVYQENEGLSAARNTGIRLAQGELLAFLDADDEWEPEFLMRCRAALIRNPALAFVYTRTYYVDQQGARLPGLGGQALSGASFRERIHEGGFFPVHAVLLRRQHLESVGDFDVDLTSVEDWDLWLRISKEHPVQGIAEPLVRYRVQPASMSTDVERMHANRLAVLAKHFGQLEGEPQTWPEDRRRAYAFAYRTSALGYIGRGDTDEGWGQLRHAVEVEPGLLARLDTFYELALGDQPRGYRGDAKALDVEASHAELRRRLDHLFTSASPSVQAHKRVAFGNGYLALAMLSDQAGKWTAARSYMRRAVRICPALLRDRSVVRRLVKLHLGRRLVGSLRRLRRGPGAGVMD
jgi:glycosyltransferase involved in cell wall biosynthesis